MPWIEITGYSGSVLIAASLMMSNIRKLRWINLCGASTFALYGLLTKTYPVLALNSFISLVDVYYLVQMSRQKDYFTISEIPKGSYLFLNRFLKFYAADIRKFFPEFNWETLEAPHCVFILRNLIPVGLFIYEPKPGGIAEIHLDYVRPEYRDFKNARYFYCAQIESLKAKKLHTFIARSSVKAHQQYLRRVGFQADAQEAGVFFKTV